MRGYRCDNCRDFAPPTVVKTWSILRPEQATETVPEGWIKALAPGKDTALHFCSPACVVANFERIAREAAA